MQAARGFAGNIVEVRRIPANHAAECDHRVEAAARGEPADHHRQLEGTGNAHHREVVRAAAALEPGGSCTLEQTRDDEIVEARRDDGHAPSVRAHLAFDEIGAHHSYPA